MGTWYCLLRVSSYVKYELLSLELGEHIPDDTKALNPSQKGLSHESQSLTPQFCLYFPQLSDAAPPK